jgi:hypothetical protein
MGRAVQVPAIVSLITVLIGIIGALMAIPAAAAIRLLDEIAIRRLDTS